MRSIADIYSAGPEHEWGRLTKSPYNSLELTTFLHHISATFPKPGLVLDAGGGPGRYTIELARRGYDVVLYDIAEGCVDFARDMVRREPPEVQTRVREFAVGDVRDMRRFASGTFDGVLCLDPLSVLPEPADRTKALSELVRVARPGGMVAVAVRGLVDVLRTIGRAFGHELLDSTVTSLRSNGNCPVGGFMHHFYRADELRGLAESAGLATVLMSGGEGLASGMPEAMDRLAAEPERWRAWEKLAVDMSTDPTVVDMSGHMLYIGRTTRRGLRARKGRQRTHG